MALWLLAGWTVLPSSTYHGLPAAGTASHLWTAWLQAHADFAAAVTPVTTTTGYTLLAVLGTGAVAILGDWAAFRWRSALYAVAPAFAYFVVCCILGAGPGREWAVALEVAALLVFLVVHRATVGPRRPGLVRQPAGRSRQLGRPGRLRGRGGLARGGHRLHPAGRRNRGARHLRLAGRIRRRRLRPPPGTQPRSWTCTPGC